MSSNKDLKSSCDTDILLLLSSASVDGNSAAGNVAKVNLLFPDLRVQTGIEETQQIIIPRKGVIELVRLLDGGDENINIEISQNHIRASKEAVQFTSKLIDGKFPDYQRVIPKGGGLPYYNKQRESKTRFGKGIYTLE